MIAEGQIMGGVCQGIGGGLLEEVVYDESGQLLTGSLMDYLIPSASDMPPIEMLHTETPSPLNELGVKGLGEGGAIAPPVVIVNAVCDALQPLQFEVFSTPLRRSTSWRRFPGGRRRNRRRSGPHLGSTGVLGRNLPSNTSAAETGRLSLSAS